MNPSQRRLAAIAITLTLFLVSCGGSSTKSKAEPVETTTTVALTDDFAGYVRSPALDVSSVTLPTVGGEPLNMVAKPDGLLFVFFGYTTCPDICPMTLSLIKVALAGQPKADQARVQVAMITIDPSRDTGELLAKYVTSYLPTGIAIRTEDPAELRAAADAFGADFRVRSNQKGQREVSHTDDLYVVDDTGTVILAWPFGTTAQQIEADLRRLLAGDRPEADDPEATNPDTTNRMYG